MRHPRNIIQLVLLLSFLSVDTYAGVFGSNNYDDCLLANLKGVTNTLSANEIKKSCARQFPKSVPLDEIDLIVRVVNSGVLMLDSHYKAVHKRFYSDMSYDDYLQKTFETKYKTNYKDLSFEEFLKQIEYRAESREPVSAANVLFRPSGCEFSVTFPSTPKVQSTGTSQGTMQQAVLEHGTSLFRAECGTRSKEAITYFQKRLQKNLLDQANLFGLENPSAGVESSAIGTIGTYRGFKKVGGEIYQYMSRVYFGKHTMFQVHLMEPSRQGATVVGNNFLNSVKRHQ